MSSPTITTIIPVHNGERYLAAAIHSVLDQTLPPHEIIVIDDGSIDGSRTITRSFGPPVRLLTQANLGPAAARNLGVDHATGDLLAFLDADDLWTPEKVARQVSALQCQSTLEAVLGQVENFISPDLDQDQHNSLFKSATQTGELHIGALLIRRDTFSRIGGFDTRWRHGEFIDWWARATRLGLNYTVLPDLVLRRRLHTTNMTRREQNGRREYLALLREQLGRRRAPCSG
ncbi:MAG: glycosyltransferase family 2 protein [Caldilineaceae bacterium]|nr:glycosyltransferase family 2 protein [Caldilineaceae bacterium]